MNDEAANWGGLVHFQPRQSGTAQTNRIALALLGRGDNSPCENAVIDVGLSGSVEFFTCGVESFAHNPRRPIIEGAVA